MKGKCPRCRESYEREDWSLCCFETASFQRVQVKAGELALEAYANDVPQLLKALEAAKIPQ